MFASDYLHKNGFQPALSEPVDSAVKLTVVIPCYIEPDILKTLESLAEADPPDCKVEVVVVINHSEAAGKEIVAYNQATFREISAWKLKHPDPPYRLLVIGPVGLQKKWAGAGLARKKGMDEAVYRFNLSGNAAGIIVSLDADTIVDANYLTEIENHFLVNSGHVGATISFNHQKAGLSVRQDLGIRLYEKYLFFYRYALEYTGYPYSMFTVGSAFAVTAGGYVKRGGMTRRKAGEDFYFLQNLAFIGEIGEITSTCVHPSARESMRVPFGTGASITRWLNETDDLAKTFNFQAFIDLKSLFDQKDDLYKMDETAYPDFIGNLPSPVAEFMLEEGFRTDINDLSRNCSSLEVYRERFFQKFNAFKILKYLNFTHDRFYTESDLNAQLKVLERVFVPGKYPFY